MASLIFKMAASRPVKLQKSKKALGVLPKGILTPSFIEIAPAVMKRALLTDIDDGRHVIAIGELKMKDCMEGKKEHI
jgi:hypothetical protein